MPDPTVSIIVAAYNVEPYLQDLLDSLDAQTFPKERFEVIVVNDGSTDRTGEILASWQTITQCHVTTRTIDNGGAAAARNTGIEIARGEWLTFCDSDDAISDNYLSVIVGLLTESGAPRVDLGVGNLVYLEQQTKKMKDTHPLRRRFIEGDRVVDLAEYPQYIHLATNTGFYRREVVEARQIRFDPRLRPVFEDAHFTGRYLLAFERPKVAYARSAIYRYRRGRADNSSLMQGAWAHDGKLTVVLELGWLDLLRRAHAEYGRVPAWIQNMVIYDLFWYLSKDRASPSPIPSYAEPVKARFHELLTEIAPYLDRENVEEFDVNWVSAEHRTTLAIGLFGQQADPLTVLLDPFDSAAGLVRYHYYFIGAPPAETVHADGAEIEPVHAKYRTHTFVGRTLAYERIGWLPAARDLSVSLDGRPAPLAVGRSASRPTVVTPDALRSELSGGAADKPPAVGLPRRPRTVVAGPRDLKGKAREGKAVLLAWYAPQRLELRRRRAQLYAARTLLTARVTDRQYARAWLLIDRDTQAQDNAEHLYRYLAAQRPEVNAWFVLDPASPDWARLQAEGFRLIAHGSRDHTAALMQAEHLISSQIDGYIVKPPAVRRLRKPRWQLTFLQHGVTKDDLSNWLNSKPIRLMITATPQEQAGFAGDWTPYVFTTREVQLTGFPRHDRLLQLAQSVEPSERAIVVMPTWRRNLVDFTGEATSNRPLVPGFWESSFGTAWRSFLADPALAEAARRTGRRIVFVPHPIVQGALADHPLPDHVEVRTFDEVDIQATIASAGVLVTDYSSNAFEAAYLQTPVVYFQFDQEEFFGGGHAYTKGPWSYADDGFGPVLTTASDAVRAVVDLVDREFSPDPAFAQRMSTTFPHRDGRCCERTWAAIADLNRALTAVELYRPVDAGQSPPTRSTAS